MKIDSMITPSGLILCAGILAAVAGVLAAIGGFWSAARRSDADALLRTKTEEISTLNRKLDEFVTGGKSFCYFIPLIFKGDTSCSLRIIYQGDCPLYDLYADITDVVKLNQLVQQDMLASTPTHDFSSAGVSLRIGTISSTTPAPEHSFPLTSDYYAFSITFLSRNSRFHEYLAIAKVNQEWVPALRVSKDSDILIEQIHPEFPIGKLPWN